MAGFDGAAFGREVVDIVKEHVRRRLAPHEEQIKELQTRVQGLEQACSELRIYVDDVLRNQQRKE